MGIPYVEPPMNEKEWLQEQIAAYNFYTNAAVMEKPQETAIGVEIMNPQETSTDSKTIATENPFSEPRSLDMYNAFLSKYKGPPTAATGAIPKKPRINLKFRPQDPEPVHSFFAPVATTSAVVEEAVQHFENPQQENFENHQQENFENPRVAQQETFLLDEAAGFQQGAFLTYEEVCQQVKSHNLEKEKPLFNLMNMELVRPHIRIPTDRKDDVSTICEATNRLCISQKGNNDFQPVMSMVPNREPMISLRETKKLFAAPITAQLPFSSQSDVPVVSQFSTGNNPQFPQEPRSIVPGFFENDLKMAAKQHQDQWNDEAAAKYWYPSHLGPPQPQDRVRVTIPMKKPKTFKKRCAKIGSLIADILFRQ